MFEITVEDAKFWKNCVGAIVNLVEEGTLDVAEGGMSLKAMDPSQIAMVCFTVPKKSFVAYKVDAPTKVSLNFDNLSKILARARDDEKLLMKTEENRLALHFEGKTKRNFKVPLIDLPVGSQKEPKVEHDAEVKMKAGQLKEILRDAALISSHVTLEATEKGLVVDAHGDTADLRVESSKTADVVEELKVKKHSKATFPLQYLEDIAKGAADDETVTLYMKTNAPVKICYSIGEASLTYYLAPRIEAE